MTNENGTSPIRVVRHLYRMDAIVCFSVAVAIASLLIKNFNEADTWWHLAIGKHIVESMEVPRFDQFTAAGWGRPYHDSHWLFQVILSIINDLGGTVAVGLVPAVCWGGTFILSFRTLCRWVTPFIASLLLCVVVVASSSRFIPRPDIVTCCMVALYYQTLQSGRYVAPFQMLFLGVMQIVWSNSHGLFVLGPFMVGCYAASAAGRNFAQTKQPSALLDPAVKLFAVTVIASLCTPFGFEGWVYAVKIAQEAGPAAHQIFRELSELQPVFSHKMALSPDGLAFYCLLAAVAGLTLSELFRSNVSCSRLAMVLGFFIVACCGRRNIPLFALVAVPFVAELMTHRCSRIDISDLQKACVILFLLGFSLLPVSGVYYKQCGYDPIRFGFGAPQEFQPSRLPAYLNDIGFKGQIYNNDLFGGYLMYRGILPLFDGRWEIYDLNELKVILNAPFDPAAWKWVEEKYGIKGVLLRHGEEGTDMFIRRFMADGSYRPVYDDKVSSFWLKSTL